MPTPETEWQAVCNLSELDDPGARDFRLRGDPPLPGFVVRHNESLNAYVNICPHAGNPLNWKPGAFLTADKSRIMCSAHGAIFEITSGRCVGGPCPGRYLRALPVRVNGDWIEVGPETDKD